MSDSESEISNSNVFTFQNGNTTVSARGPNINTNFSFRSQMSSSMYMPRNFERQRYAESVSDQRSIYYRRETSPLSIHSASNIRPRTFQPYYNGMGSQHSIFNGRSGSPASIRSIDSSASVSAADIAFAFKNVNFNKYDLRVIKDAYHKLMKQRVRKRIEKRRNLRLFLKGSRHKSGGDSGEQGSDSSISSDDCRSVKTSYQENMFTNRSTRFDLASFKRSMGISNMAQDSTPNVKNMFSVNTNFNRNHTFTNSNVAKSSQPLPILKTRFNNGFLLPSQRFNRTVASSVIPENSERQYKEPANRQNKMNCVANAHPDIRNCESGSDEEIFPEVLAKDKVIKSTGIQNLQYKRRLDNDDTNLPNKKRSKIMSSPAKNSILKNRVPLKTRNPVPVNNNDENSNHFEFVMPTLPVRKSKPKEQEKIIAKSKQPLMDFDSSIPDKIPKNIECAQGTTNIQDKQIDSPTQSDNLEMTENNDVSTRPSFLKRKLFTQTLDVTEKANSSSDGTGSSQSNLYSALQKEKNKARKLVTTQSCLNREVQDDNNLLDLIHKIVPPDRMNITNQTVVSQTKNAANTVSKDDEDKWDITSVISMCNEDNVSDTFTDEEIFGNNNKKPNIIKDKKTNCYLQPERNSNNKFKEQEQNIGSKNCKVVVEKMHAEKPVESQHIAPNISVNKPVVKTYAKTFWDTDFESDAECELAKQRNQLKENKLRARTPVLKSSLQAPETSRWLNRTKSNTLDSSGKFNISTLTLRSHRTSKKKKCCNETCVQENTSNEKKTVNRNKVNKPEKNNFPKSEDKNPKINISQTNVKRNNKKAVTKSAKKEVQNKNTKDEKSKQVRQIKTSVSPKVVSNYSLINSRPIRSCRTPSQNRSTSLDISKSSREFKITPLKATNHRMLNRQKCFIDTPDEIIHKPEITFNNRKTKASRAHKESNKSLQLNNTNTSIQEKITTKKTKSIPNTQNTNKSLHASKTSQKSKPGKQSSKNLLKYQSPLTNRPIRTCRTPSQNRSQL